MLDTVVADTDVKIRSRPKGVGIKLVFMGRAFSNKEPKRERKRKYRSWNQNGCTWLSNSAVNKPYCNTGPSGSRSIPSLPLSLPASRAAALNLPRPRAAAPTSPLLRRAAPRPRDPPQPPPRIITRRRPLLPWIPRLRLPRDSPASLSRAVASARPCRRSLHALGERAGGGPRAQGRGERGARRDEDQRECDQVQGRQHAAEPRMARAHCRRSLHTPARRRRRRCRLRVTPPQRLPRSGEMAKKNVEVIMDMPKEMARSLLKYIQQKLVSNYTNKAKVMNVILLYSEIYQYTIVVLIGCSACQDANQEARLGYLFKATYMNCYISSSLCEATPYLTSNLEEDLRIEFLVKNLVPS
ncbi:hypothetical protein U9M48_020022 [Paspalum notatum var. saurae]|uniref:Uncharacterized protein n=1 Tax=Paspalum notatum var. saurae TaxID=547442 RepID=A0AAQ3TF67_PASNO